MTDTTKTNVFLSTIYSYKKMFLSALLCKTGTEDALLNHFQPARGSCSLEAVQSWRLRRNAQKQLVSGLHRLWGACRSFSNRKYSLAWDMIRPGDTGICGC